MPEYFDLKEAGRLLEDASALAAEMRSGDPRPAAAVPDPRAPPRRCPGWLCPEALELFWEAQDKAERVADVFRSISAHFAQIASALEEQDMARIRNARAGIRSLVMEELGRRT